MSNSQNQPIVKGADPGVAGEPGKANGTTMLTIGCKLPNGLVCEMGKYGDESYTQVRLNGANSARVIGGYGLTQVSKDFWDAWYKKNKGLSFMRGKEPLVFAHGDESSAADHAKDNAEIRTGLEALDPFKDDRIKMVNGAPRVEVDMDHLNAGRAAVAQFGGGRR